MPIGRSQERGERRSKPRICMKRTAFLSFDWDYDFVSRLYQGMEAYLEDTKGVQLIIFNAFGHYEASGPEDGTFGLFDLYRPQDYDGLIVQGNRAWPYELRQRLVDEARALGKPVVSINEEFEGAYYVGTDNYAAECGLVRRVLRDRAFTRPAFVRGPESSREAAARLQGFLDACAEQGIQDPQLYGAGWDVSTGTDAALEMLAKGDVPDVVFCCNDNAAYGAQRTFISHGLRVPDDVCITGFDNRELALSAQPRITSVDRDFETIGRNALMVLVALLEGGKPNAHVASPVRYALAESCGYEGSELGFEEQLAINYHLANTIHRRFFEILARFQPDVMGATSLHEVMVKCERWLPEIRSSQAFLTLNTDYLRDGTTRTKIPYGRDSLLGAVTGLAPAPPCDGHHVYARFSSHEILPPEVAMDRPLYLVYPLRQGLTCIGTLVTAGVAPIVRYGFLGILIDLVANSADSALRREMLQEMNARLDDLYVHDQLTGLFNRFGLERNGILAYEHLLRDFEEAYLIFVDIDQMKLINDRFGHDAGDQSICDTAEVIKCATVDENAFAMRYGGDEFLLICRRDLTPKLAEELVALKERESRPFDLSLSMGVEHVTTADGLTLTDAIEKADARMYEIKRARKARARAGQ